MKVKTYISLFFVASCFAAPSFADTVVLRNGESIQGSFLGATSRQIRIDANGNIRTLDISQVQSISFDDPAFSNRPRSDASAADPGYRRDPNGYAAQDAPPPSGSGIWVPADTNVTVRMIQAVNSQNSRLGDTFRASLDEPIFVNGQEAIGRGADVLTKLVEDQQSGKFEGRTVLTLALVSITVNGRDVPVTSSDVKTESSSRGARTAGTVGGGTALGAIVGALAGGGKGAAIGAASGATVGAGVEVLTQGQVVKIPSETRLTFRLRSSFQI